MHNQSKQKRKYKSYEIGHGKANKTQVSMILKIIYDARTSRGLCLTEVIFVVVEVRMEMKARNEDEFSCCLLNIVDEA